MDINGDEKKKKIYDDPKGEKEREFWHVRKGVKGTKNDKEKKLIEKKSSLLHTCLLALLIYIPDHNSCRSSNSFLH